MKVIFLDIDGPMIPASMYLVDPACGWKRMFPSTTIAVINTLCDRTGAKIVLNTTHNLRSCAAADIDIALIHHGIKPDHFHPDDKHTEYPDVSRKEAVKRWLSRHPEVTEWVAIDDDRFIEDDRLLLVDPDYGVSVPHLNAALEKFGSKPMLFLM